MNNDELMLLEKRMMDLSRQAECKGIVLFSDFLSLSEQQVVKMNTGKLDTKIAMSGGFEFAERQMVAFIPDALYYEWEYPFVCLNLEKLYPKFSEELNHRDILGALMSLGIVRGKIGDILVTPTQYLVFAEMNIADYICQELTSIRHTMVKPVEIPIGEIDYQPEFELCEARMTSNRLDSVVAAIQKLSRSESLKKIQEGKVFLNGTQCLHNTYYCKPNDIISIRGTGKFMFLGEVGKSRKDKIIFQYKIYK